MSNIPIILLSHDRLSTLEKLCDQLTLLGYDNINILDLGSTYTPLLDWYKVCDHEVIMADNIGHKGLWNAGYIKLFENWPFVAVSDSDIELNLNTPKGFIEDMVCIAKDYRVDKIGCAIEYRDITNPVLKQIITPIEQQYWQKRLAHVTWECFSAPVDTTMCVVKPQLPFQYHAVRVAEEYTIKHCPWYEDWNNLTEEQIYYHTHADPLIATGTKFYNDWKREH